MADSSIFPIKWAQFPSASAAKKLIEKAKKRALKNEGQPPTPYQFTMPIMAHLYKDLLPSVAKSLVLVLENDDLKASPPPPTKVADAGKAQLRAIAYFSWDGGRRLFATRRVYPTYFDFVSLSYVDEGWGALGELLAAIDDGKVNGRKPFVAVKNISKNHRFLPFLKEADRLDYQAAFVIPFFKQKRKRSYPCNRELLLGAIVFYLKDAEALPKKYYSPNGLAKRIRTFSRLLAGVIRDHEHGKNGIQQPVMGKTPKDDVFKYWPEVYENSVDDVFYAILTIQRKWSKIRADEIAGKIQTLLSGVDLLCIRDERYRSGLRFWATGLLDSNPPKPKNRDEFARFLRNEIAEAVAKTFVDHGRVNLQIKIHGKKTHT